MCATMSQESGFFLGGGEGEKGANKPRQRDDILINPRLSQKRQSQSEVNKL